MTTEAFLQLNAAEAAKHPPLLHALWQAAHGHWDKAHQIAQEIETPDGAWVHAYLHRVEGDTVNAAYWYRRANKPVPKIATEAECREITTTLLP